MFNHWSDLQKLGYSGKSRATVQHDCAHLKQEYKKFINVKGHSEKNIGTTAKNIHDLLGPTNQPTLFAITRLGVSYFGTWQLALISSIVSDLPTAAGCCVIGSTANLTECHRKYSANSAGHSTAIIS